MRGREARLTRQLLKFFDRILARILRVYGFAVAEREPLARNSRLLIAQAA